jgi:tetratricopeptide (TPR) repeat protein
VGGNEHGRNPGKRSFFKSRFPFLSHWPAWKRFALLALVTTLVLIVGGAILSWERDSQSARASGNPRASIRDAATGQPRSDSQFNPKSVNSANSDSPSDISELPKNAKNALDSGQFEEAATQYRRALEINPSNEDAHFGLAMAMARLGREDEAVQEYGEALRLMPNYAEVHNNLGNLLAKQGKLTEAIEHFQTALKINPDYASAFNNLGTVLARQGLFDQAKESFEKAVKASPGYAAAHYNLGNSLMRERNPLAAITEYEQVLRLQPDFQQATKSLVVAREQAAALQNSGNGPLAPTPP